MILIVALLLSNSVFNYNLFLSCILSVYNSLFTWFDYHTIVMVSDYSCPCILESFFMKCILNFYQCFEMLLVFDNYIYF